MPAAGAGYVADGGVYYDIYTLVAGVWSKAGNQIKYKSQYGMTTGGNKTLNYTDTYSLSSSAVVDKIRVVQTGFYGTGATIDSGTLVWTGQTTSSDRSATPSGEKIVATMRPS
jgi:hypothetical protein